MALTGRRIYPYHWRRESEALRAQLSGGAARRAVHGHSRVAAVLIASAGGGAARPQSGRERRTYKHMKPQIKSEAEYNSRAAVRILCVGVPTRIGAS